MGNRKMTYRFVAWTSADSASGASTQVASPSFIVD
jgi:hypothetical protein